MLRLRRQRRQLTVLRADQQRGAPGEVGLFRPLGLPLRARLPLDSGVLRRISGIRFLGIGYTLGVLLVGQPHAVPEHLGPLHQDAHVVEVFVLESVADVRVAPRRLARVVVGRYRRQLFEVGGPLLRSGGRAHD